MEQAQWRITRPRAYLQSAVRHTLITGCAPLLLAIGLSLLIFLSLYPQSFTSVQNIGEDTTSITGLYPPEQSADFSYAYSVGDSRVHVSAAGSGQFIINLRLGGPNGSVPVATQLMNEAQPLVLGPIAPLRVYHLLIPSSRAGDLDFTIRGETSRLAGETRDLGVLIDWVSIRSIGRLDPPSAMLLVTLIALVCVWLLVTQLQVPLKWKFLVLLISSALLSGIQSVYHNERVMPTWWYLGPSLLVASAVTLSRMETWPFRRPLVGIFAIFFFWRVIVWLVAGLSLWYSDQVYQLGKSITLGGETHGRNHLMWRTLTTSWSHWDSGQYYEIVERGYTFLDGSHTIAFFPLYPLLTRLVLPLTNSDIVSAGLLISHVALFTALIFLYDLVAQDFNSTLGYRAVICLLIFPTSFFFVAVYSEALALALIIASVWAMRRRYWWLAGLAGFFLTLTRLPGVLVAPVIAVIYLQENHWRWQALLRPAILSVLLPPLGLLLFMLYQWQIFGTPFAFMIAQQSWNNFLRPPWGTPYELITTITTSSDWPMKLVQAGMWLWFLICTVAAFRRLPLAYGLTMFLILIPPYLSSWNESLPRYVLMGFPAFIIMAIYAQRLPRRMAITGLSLFLLMAGTILYVNGFWIG